MFTLLFHTSLPLTYTRSRSESRVPAAQLRHDTVHRDVPPGAVKVFCKLRISLPHMPCTLASPALAILLLLHPAAAAPPASHP